MSAAELTKNVALIHFYRSLATLRLRLTSGMEE
jgi:hypothetical protein